MIMECIKMVKLLLKSFKQQKANKNHNCDSCFLQIAKGMLYKKNSKDNTKLHEHCFRSLSLQSAKDNLDNIA